MYLKKIIIKRIIEDPKFRERLSIVLGITNRATYNMAIKYSKSPFPNSNFTKIAAINFFKEEEYTDEQIVSETLVE